MKYRALSASQVIVTCGRAAAAAIVQFMLLLVPQQIEKKTKTNPNKPQQNKKP